MEKLFFDLETTGPDSSKDRIVQLAIRLTDEDGNVILNKSKLYNPGMPISPAATEIHGITDADVKNCPKFAEDAKKLRKLFENKIIITYNGLMFDIPIIMNEFDRAGVEVNLSGKFIDVYKVEKKLHPQTLSNVYKTYVGKDLENAHDAKSDNRATSVVLDHQMEIVANKLEHADGLGAENVPSLEDMLYELSGTKDIVDFYGKFTRDAQGYLIFNFGKHKGNNVRVVDDLEYATWILSQNFPNQIKSLIKEEQKKVQREIFKKTTSQAKGFYQPPTSRRATATEFNFGGVASNNDDIPDDLPF